MQLRPDERDVLEEELAAVRGETLAARDRAIRGYVELCVALSDMRRGALRGSSIRSQLSFAEAGPTMAGLVDPLGILTGPDEWRGLLADAEALAAAAMPRRSSEGTVTMTIPVFGANRRKAAADASQEIR